jgi:hypothetical protein
MPTLEHNAPIEMFRENPSLVAHFLATVFHMEVPPHASVRVADSALDQMLPVEFRADLVLELRDATGALVLAVILESQREKTPRKKYSWAVYWAVARAERECPAVVLVLAYDAEVAAWAAEKIDLGLGRGSIEPLVLGPATLPVVTDPAVAEKEVELAVLSAMAHGNGPDGLAVIQAAWSALDRLDLGRGSFAATTERRGRGPQGREGRKGSRFSCLLLSLRPLRPCGPLPLSLGPRPSRPRVGPSRPPWLRMRARRPRSQARRRI